jgi:hypothetical protein
VWRRIRHIASIATFLRMIEWMTNLVMMPLQKLGSCNKNAYLALPKHVGGPSSIHNVASISFHDFDNQRSNIKHKVSS